jgi:hypothetical protein
MPRRLVSLGVGAWNQPPHISAIQLRLVRFYQADVRRIPGDQCLIVF